MSLEGRSVIVTGGNSGIGKAISSRSPSRVADLQRLVDTAVSSFGRLDEDWPMPGNTPYCLSKGGVRMLTRTAGMRVIGVAPGAVATPINLVEMDPETLAKVEGSIPMGRMAQPEEVAAVVAFLASPGAGYMTGTTVFVDGAIMMQSPGL